MTKITNLLGTSFKMFAIFTFIIGVYGAIPTDAKLSNGFTSIYTPLVADAWGGGYGGCGNDTGGYGGGFGGDDAGLGGTDNGFGNDGMGGTGADNQNDNYNNDTTSANTTHWSDFSDWGSCSATCGGGTQTRTRTCVNDALPGIAYNNVMCTGGDAAATQSQACNVTACAIAPTCTLSPSDVTIFKGESVTLTLTSSDAVDATIDNGVGSVAMSSAGTKTITPEHTLTYTATVSGAGGTGSCDAHITVNEHPTPTCNIYVDNANLSHNGGTTLHWSSSNAVSIEISNGIGYEWENHDGSVAINGLTSNTTYTCTVRGANNTEASNSTTVNVAAAPVITYPTCNISASNANPAYNGTTTLSWDSSNATSIEISNGIGYRWQNHSQSESLTGLKSDITYTCTAKDAAGHTATNTVTIDVQAKPVVASTATPSTSSSSRSHRSSSRRRTPKCTIEASATEVVYGGSTTISWDSSRAKEATLKDFGRVDLDGSQVFSNITKDTTYKLTVESSNGRERSCSQLVKVRGRVAGTSTVAVPYTAPVASGTPSCQIIANGNTLTWSSTNAVSAIMTELGMTSINGSITVMPLTTKKYTLTVFNNGKRASCDTTVSIVGPATSVTLTSVPYTGAEDYIYPMFLLALMLTAGYAASRRTYIFA